MLSFARVRAIAVVALLVIGAAVTVAMALSRGDDGPSLAQRCPDGFVRVDLALPEEHDIQINVFNGTARTGLASRIGNNFSHRGFEVFETADHHSELDAVAELHYGPRTVGAAQVVRAYFLNETVMVFDINREDEVVDVVLGTGFRQLATPTEVKQAIAAAGNPRPPEGTCPADPDS